MLTACWVWRRPGKEGLRQALSLADVAQTYAQTLRAGVVAAAGLAIVRP
jgi:hypothetical protein